MLTLRRAGASDPRVLAAFEDCSRLAFVDPQFADIALEDVSIPLPCGQTSLRPSVLAMMLDALNVEAAHKVLLVGAGAGFSAAILARVAGRVFALDRYKTLCDLTMANLAKAGAANVQVIQADGLEGLVAEAPFDRILLTGAVAEIPAALEAQLAQSGVLAAPVLTPDGATAILQRCEQVDGGLQRTNMFELQLEPLQQGIARHL
jgi:protein-L-isoaspartate(D-aspartate) O-methyltransferase